MEKEILNEKNNRDLSRLIVRMSFNFDAGGELRRVLDDLRFDLPELKENIINPKERESQPELNMALRAIDTAKKRYLLRLKVAQASGQIDREDYFRAERDATHSFERFERDVWERYQKTT